MIPTERGDWLFAWNESTRLVSGINVLSKERAELPRATWAAILGGENTEFQLFERGANLLAPKSPPPAEGYLAIANGWAVALSHLELTNNYPFARLKSLAGGSYSAERMREYARGSPDSFRWLTYKNSPRSGDAASTELDGTVRSLCLIRSEIKAPWTDTPLFRRATPSGGARHPTEVFLCKPSSNARQAEVLHFDVNSAEWRALGVIQCEDKWRETLFPLLARRTREHDLEGVLLFGSCLDKNAYRYREPRTLRSVFLDGGHMLGAAQRRLEAVGRKVSIQFGAFHKSVLAVISHPEHEIYPIAAASVSGPSISSRISVIDQPAESMHARSHLASTPNLIRLSSPHVYCMRPTSGSVEVHSLQELRNKARHRDPLFIEELLITRHRRPGIKSHFVFAEFDWHFVQTLLRCCESLQYADDLDVAADAGHVTPPNLHSDAATLAFHKFSLSQVDASLKHRTTCRNFAKVPCERHDMTALLTQTFSRLRACARSAKTTSNPFISAGLGVRVYILAVNVKGVESGIYSYDVVTEVMIRCGPLPDIGALLWDHAFVQHANFGLILCQAWQEKVSLYQSPQCLLNSWIEHGMIAQDACFSLAEGWGMFQTPAIVDDTWSSLLNSSVMEESAIYATFFGRHVNHGISDSARH